ncbi:MAG: thiolase family protein [Rubrivivax sp.]|nr:thiolase family protein [Rubrivivax sp.]MBK8527488.1 thiolase family protein [Rubrivivax sp.]
MEPVYIVGVGMTKLGRHLDKSVKQLSALAIDAALADAGCAKEAIDVAWFSNTRQGLMEGQHGIRGQCALRAYGFEGLPIINTDNACASSTTGLNQAVAYLRAGMAEVALVVGAEKMNYPDKRELMFEAFKGAMDRDLGEEQLKRSIALAADLPLPPEALAAESGERSIFMDSYAAGARYHMLKYGSTQRQLAAVAAKNHWHASMNPLSHYRTPRSIEEVLADRIISWPLTRAMCAPISDGAAAIVVCSKDALARFNRKRAVQVLATVLVSGVKHAPDDAEKKVPRLAALKAFEQAGIGPQDISVAEVHDATAYGEVKHVEALGLCPVGEGGALAERGVTKLGGKVPVNPSGGLLAKGHPVAATGAIQIYELVTQLRGEAGDRQVVGARIAVAGNGGGNYDGEEAVSATTILGKV